MAILVVGGAGYIGSHAARALRRSGYEVIVYDNLSTGHRRLAQGFELVVGDIADETKRRMPASSVAFNRRSPASTLFWKYLRGFSTDSPT